MSKDMSTEESGSRVSDDSKSEDMIFWCLSKLYQLTIGSCVRSCCRTPFRFCQKYLCCKDIPSEDELEMSDVASDDETTPLCDEDHWMKKRRIEKVDARLKGKLKHRFQDHINKWVQNKHPRFPWKLIVHLLLVGLVTAQVSIFATDKYKLMSFLNQNRETFENYFVRKECNSPINVLYTLDDVYKQIEYTVNSYYNISQQGVNAFEFIEDHDHKVKNATYLKMAVYYDSDCDDCGENCNLLLFPYNTSNSSLNKSCCCVNNCSHHSASAGDCTVTEQVKCHINGDNLQTICRINFNFKVFMSYQKHVVEDYNAVNVTFHVDINFDNKMYNNLILDIEATASELDRYHNGFWSRRRTTVVDAIVLVLLLISFWTYILSVFRSSMLAKEVKLHFLAYHERHLRWKELSPLYNKWYMWMLFTNLLIFVATLLKLYSDYSLDINIDLLEAIGLLLGMGILLLWCGLFGLLKHFESLHVILITVELAIPSILRFAVYIGILFVGFSLCGWLILGSYHSKFEGPLVTAVSLYCILNGDDLYETFNKMDTQSETVKIFSQIYLCIFMFLFIYIVLSLFIGIFNHAYESLSKKWRERSRGFLRDWVEGEHKTDPTKNYPFPIPRVRKQAVYPISEDPYVDDHSGESSLTTSSVSIHETPTMIPDVPVIQVTDPTDHLATLSVNNNIGRRGRASSDSNLLAPQADEDRRWLGHSLNPNTMAGHTHRHTFHGPSGPHLMVYQQHSPKALAAEPPRANKREVAKARSKLWASNPHLHLDIQENDA